MKKYFPSTPIFFFFKKVIHVIIKIANADNNNNNKNENNNNNNDNNNNNVHEQTFLKINDFDNMYGMMFMGLGKEFPDFPEYSDPENEADQENQNPELKNRNEQLQTDDDKVVRATTIKLKRKIS
jgi:hypothetical protein